MHRAQPVSEMERSGIELHGAKPDDRDAQPVSEMEQSGIELHGAKPDGRIQSVYFEKNAKNLDCIPVIYFKITT